MTLLEMKKKVLQLIEEISTNESKLTDDPDIEAKLNSVINQIQFEAARMKKIPKKIIYNVDEEERKDLDLTKLEDYYQLDIIRFKNENDGYEDYDIRNNDVTFPCFGKATIYYYKYPVKINKETIDEEYEFELSDDILEIMPYGIAADLLKSDVSSNYGQIYAQRYEQMMQRLDPRYNAGSIYIESGIEVL